VLSDGGSTPPTSTKLKGPDILRALFLGEFEMDKLCHPVAYFSSMKRVFKTRHFQRWMRKTELVDAALCKAVEEMAAGLIDADLGGNVVKKRVGWAGRGKRGGARTLVATNKGNRWFFVFGFEKNERANVSGEELEALQDTAADLLALTGQQLDVGVADGTLQEICQ
jgi:hypothetical protein